MKKFLLSILFPLVIFAQTNNTNGWGDTCTVTTFKKDSTKVSTVWNMSGFENMRCDVFAADTDAAGFSTDSIKFLFQVRTGHRVLNASNAVDTDWTNWGTLDTFDIASAGEAVATYDSTTGSMIQKWREIDTTSLTGYASQSIPYSPDWDELIQLRAKGLTGNNVGSFLKLRFSLTRRIGANVRNR